MKLRWLSWVVVVALVGACSADPQAGDECEQENSGGCESDSVALFCEDGRLRAIPCSGAGGCTENSSQFVCDFSKAKAGEACRKANEDQVQCDVSNANQLLRCVSGIWKAETCKECSTEGNQLVCAL